MRGRLLPGGWRVTRSFSLSRSVPTPAPAVVDFLMDLGRHRGLHPYLVSAEVVDSGRSASGRWQEWLVRERPRLGPVRYPVRFRARTTRTSSTSMAYDVRVPPAVRLHGTTRADVDSSGLTTVTETVEVTAPRPLVGYVTRQARAAHARTLDRLPASLV